MRGPAQPANLADPKLYERLDDAAIANTIEKGKGEMPPFKGWIQGEELKNLIAYLHTLPADAAKHRAKRTQ